MPGRFDGKVIVVTGGARGIGEAVVRRAVDEGARGVVADLGEPGGPARRRALRPTDVADRASVEALFASIAAEEGGVDILVNNAGIQRVGLTETFDPAVWEQVIQTHLMGAFHCSAHGHPLDARPGRRAHHPDRLGGGHDRPARTRALLGREGRAHGPVTRVMAVEVADLGIRVNAVAPGLDPHGDRAAGPR